MKTDATAKPPTAVVRLVTIEVAECNYKTEVPPPGSFDKLVTVRVGRTPRKKEYQVHRGLLCHYSTVSKQLLLRETVKVISLPDFEPDVFEIVKYWLYTSRFWIPTANRTGQIPFDDDKILQLLYFARENGMQELQNASMTLFYQKNAQDWAVAIPQAKNIYARTTPKSPLRRFFVDMVAETWDSRPWRVIRLRFPKNS